MWINNTKPDLYWISNQRYSGEEWIKYTKKIYIDKNIKSAVFRFESDCVCGVYINDEFVISGTGRAPERVNCHEVTSRFVVGENTFNVVLGTTYFQKIGHDMKEQRGYWLNSFALELCFEFEDGSKMVVPTDSSWIAHIDEQQIPAMETMPVTDAEYNMMWRWSTPWVEADRCKKPVADEIVNTVGQTYADYINISDDGYAYPVTDICHNVIKTENGYEPDKSSDESYVIFDFGRLVVGYTDISYNTTDDTQITLDFDFSERVSDFDFDINWEWTPVVERLRIVQKICAKNSSAFNLRRRAFRFVRVKFEKNSVLKINNIRVRTCMFPVVEQGWFNCSDAMLNKAWEVGKYTLHVNKQQEYESCPRNEMAFFSGDGYIDALVDLYAFGNEKLLASCLSLRHTEACGGIASSTEFNKSRHQWDYYAWRVISVHLHYQLTGDMEFLKKFYNDARDSLLWQIGRMGKNKLIFQSPCYFSTYTYILGQVDWACSPARLGEKPYLNGLLYKSLVSMAELADVMGDTQNRDEWNALAKEVKDAINTLLWSDEKQAYMDSMDDYVSQDGNVIPVLFGIADKQRAVSALKTVKDRLWSPYGASILDAPIGHTRGGNVTVSPLMCAYEAEARFINGQPDEALDLIRRCWGGMLAKGAETFWEFTPNNGHERWDAVCHAWSSGCTYLLSAYILGIKMTKPGYESIKFEPNICDLTEFDGVVPTEKGLIAVSYRQTEKEGKILNTFKLTVPEGMETEIVLPENSDAEIIKYKI